MSNYLKNISWKDRRCLVPIILILCNILFFSITAPALATVDQEVVKTLALPDNPIATTNSGDGQLFFVLTASGKVLIYSSGGTLRGSFESAGSPDLISSSPDGSLLYLTDKESRATQILAVDFVQNIDIQGAPIKGDAAGKVTIVVFSDFQCPYCARVVPLLDQMLEQYPKGLRIAYKNFPLRMHKFAGPAAVAAWAAQQQGKFWQMHDLIFANNSNLRMDKLKELAQQLNLDMARFEKDIRSSKANERIQADLADGVEAGVRGTPTIFVNGRRLKAKSSADLKNMIEAAMPQP